MDSDISAATTWAIVEPGGTDIAKFVTRALDGRRLRRPATGLVSGLLRWS